MVFFVKAGALLLLAQLLALSVAPGDVLVDANGGKVVFCYWGTWSYYRPGNGKFEASHINPQLCTHIGYAFFGLSNDGSIRLLDEWLDVDLGTIAQVVALKKQNANLKVLASVGGWSEGSTKYSAMAADANKRATFVASTLNLMATHGFDGLDLDWEYPAQRGGSAADRSNFVTLLAQLKTALKAKNLLLTIAVAATASSASISYDIPAVSQQVDLINVMSYDLGGSWDPVLEHNAPLQGAGDLTVKAAIEYWLSQGAPANKLVLGIPLYGRTFTMANSAQTTPGSPSTGAGTAGPFTREAGFLGYNEICADSAGWTRQWDATHLVPYTYKGNQWVSYDNEQSIGEKVAFLKSHNLAGAMVWSIETDDFRGVCGQAYPLLRAVNQYLGDGSTSQPSTNEPSQSTTTSSTTAGPPAAGGVNCSSDGTFADPRSCDAFYICSEGVVYYFTCPPGLLFDPSVIVCNWPELVTC